jgi:DNA-directed RNA polymerase specialized sigma24 family protein
MAIEALTLDLIDKGRAIVNVDFRERGGDRLTWRLDTKTPQRPRAYTYDIAGGRHRRLYLERFVTNVPPGKFVRFRNGNTLDCRRANLEVVDRRSEIMAHENARRQAWALEEVNAFKACPQRRRIEGWRLWCEGYPVEEIARLMGCSAKEAGTDLAAMAADPLAAESAL